MRTSFALVVLFITVATLACTTRTALVNLWVDPRLPAAPMERVLVVALWQDPEARSLWEERFAEAVEQCESDAIVSYLGLPTSIPDSAAVFWEAGWRKCDGVIVIHQHVVDFESFYVPGYSMPRATKKPRWHRYAGGIEEWMGESGGTAPPALRCDVELWSASARTDMVWSGTTEVVDPGDDDHAASQVADTAIRELARLGLVFSRL